MPSIRLLLIALTLGATPAFADTPSATYLYPAGGQRGTTVSFRVGGTYLHEGCPFRMDGPGVQAVNRIERTETLWFEGPVIPQPASQRKEDYPKDYAGTVEITADAAVGSRTWRVWTSQGVTAGMPFVVGDLPEILEEEIDGAPIPREVTLPLTINGRIFPREDIDIWTFRARAGQTVTCSVAADRIGSGLDPRIEIRDASGRTLAENSDALGADALVHFTAPADGLYAVHLYDEMFGGLQHYVYRLTLTDRPWVDSVFPLGGRRGGPLELEVRGANLKAGQSGTGVATASVTLPGEANLAAYETALTFGGANSNPVTFELGDFPEVIEPASGVSEARPVELPVVANGRISKAGETDSWTFPAMKGVVYEIDLRASRLGSPLDSVITLLDASGKQLAVNDDLAGGQPDSRLLWTAPADGPVTVQVADRLSSRGGPTYAYRLRMVPNAKPDFQITIPVDAVTVERGKTFNLKGTVERRGFQEEIELVFVGLPEGVTATNAKVGKGQTQFNVTLKAEETARVAVAPLTVQGKAKSGDEEIVRTALCESTQGTPPNVQRTGTPPAPQLWLAVAMPTPFKFAGDFETKFAPRGGVFVRHYRLERNGFEGPIEVSLADRQNRHLQGVTGETIVVPPGVTEFDFVVSMPPWMEVGRTSRTCLMAVGVVTDEKGVAHKVSYSSEQQNDQIITLVDPARLSVTTRRKSLRAAPGRQIEVPFEVNRGVGLSGPVTVSLEIPRHFRGVKSSPVTIPAEAKAGVLSLEFADPVGSINMPLVLRAVMKDDRGYAVTNEMPVELVP